MMIESEILSLYQPPAECGDEPCVPRSVYFWEFIYCVCVPGAAVTLIVIICAKIMCCRSKSCQCRSSKTPSQNTDNVELETYNSIRRASATVRQMSHNRETALLGTRSGSMTLDRPHRHRRPRTDTCHSLPGTLQRPSRHRNADRESLAHPPAYDSATNVENGARSSHVMRFSDCQAPPPPPPYSLHADNMFLGSEFLESGRKEQEVRYEEIPEPNRNSTQPLLPDDAEEK